MIKNTIEYGMRVTYIMECQDRADPQQFGYRYFQQEIDDMRAKYPDFHQRFMSMPDSAERI